MIARRDARPIAIGSSFASAAAVSLYPLAHRTGVAQLVAVLVGLATLPGIPARMALRGQLIPASRQHSASGHIVAGERTALVLGPLIASLIAAQIGYSYIFYAEALLAVLASLPLLGLPPGAPAPGGTAPPGFWFGAYARSARVFRSDRIVSEYTGLAVVYCTGIGIRRLALPAIVLVLYGRADAGLGGLVAALAAGGILGGLLAAALGRRNLDRCYLWLTLLEACTWTVVHFHVPYAALVATLFVAGIGEGATTALFFSRVQARLDPADLGRYFVLLASTADAATVVGVLLASAVYADHVARWGPLAIAALILAAARRRPADPHRGHPPSDNA